MELRSDDDRWSFAYARRRQLMALALRHTTCREDAEDAVSDAIAAAAKSTATEPEHLYGWCRAIVIKTLRRQHRDRPSERALARIAGAERTIVLDPGELVAEADEDRWLVAAANESLTRDQLRVLELRSGGKSIAEIAAAVGSSYEATASLLARARAAIRSRAATVRGVVAGPFVRLARSLRRRGPAATTAVAYGVAAYSAYSMFGNIRGRNFREAMWDGADVLSYGGGRLASRWARRAARAEWRAYRMSKKAARLARRGKSYRKAAMIGSYSRRAERYRRRADLVYHGSWGASAVGFSRNIRDW